MLLDLGIASCFTTTIITVLGTLLFPKMSKAINASYWRYQVDEEAKRKNRGWKDVVGASSIHHQQPPAGPVFRLHMLSTSGYIMQYLLHVLPTVTFTSFIIVWLAAHYNNAPVAYFFLVLPFAQLVLMLLFWCCSQNNETLNRIHEPTFKDLNGVDDDDVGEGEFEEMEMKSAAVVTGGEGGSAGSYSPTRSRSAVYSATTMGVGHAAQGSIMWDATTGGGEEHAKKPTTSSSVFMSPAQKSEQRRRAIKREYYSFKDVLENALATADAEEAAVRAASQRRDMYAAHQQQRSPQVSRDVFNNYNRSASNSNSPRRVPPYNEANDAGGMMMVSNPPSQPHDAAMMTSYGEPANIPSKLQQHQGEYEAAATTTTTFETKPELLASKNDGFYDSMPDQLNNKAAPPPPLATSGLDSLADPSPPPAAGMMIVGGSINNIEGGATIGDRASGSSLRPVEQATLSWVREQSVGGQQ